MHPDTELLLEAFPSSWRIIAEALIKQQAIENNVELESVIVKAVRIKSSLELIEISLDLMVDRPIEHIHIAGEVVI